MKQDMKEARVRSITRLRQAFADKRLGAQGKYGCAYSSGELRCAIGAMFNDAQLADILARGLNDDVNIKNLAAKIGRKNIETVTGFSLNKLIHIQNLHDDISLECPSSLYEEDGKFAILVKYLR